MGNAPPEPRLEDLVETHRASLHTYVSFRLDRDLRLREPVSDIVQSVLREVLANPGNFTYQGPEAFRAFLIRAVENKIANKRRYWDAVKRSGTLEDLDVDRVGASEQASPTPSELASQRESLARLGSALEKLSEEDRRLFTMRRFAGLSADVIATEMGLAVSTVRFRLGRIMAILSQEL